MIVLKAFIFRLVLSLVDQFSMYANESVEKKFAVQCVGIVLDQINTDQVRCLHLLIL